MGLSTMPNRSAEVPQRGIVTIPDELWYIIQRCWQRLDNRADLGWVIRRLSGLVRQ